MGAKISGRVIIPPSAPDMMRLANTIYELHVAAGNNSELKDIPGVDWDAMGALVAQAMDFHEHSVALRQQAEDLMEKRNQLLKGITETTRITSVYLKAKHRGNAKHLGLWGYTVNDSPQPKKKVKKEAGSGTD